MESKAVLTYFKVFGRAESIRLALAHFGIEFTEVEIKHIFTDGEEGLKEWNEKKKDFQFGALPVLEIDGKTLSQSKAILRYIFMRQNQYPTDPYEVYRVESLVDLYLDIISGLESAYYQENGEEKYGIWIKENLPKRLGQLEKRLEQNSNQDYLVGDKLSMADVLFVDLRLSSFKRADLKPEWGFIKEIYSQFPKVAAYIEKRKPDFKKRLDNRPDYFQ